MRAYILDIQGEPAFEPDPIRAAAWMARHEDARTIAFNEYEYPAQDFIGDDGRHVRHGVDRFSPVRSQLHGPQSSRLGRRSARSAAHAQGYPIRAAAGVVKTASTRPQAACVRDDGRRRTVRQLS